MTEGHNAIAGDRMTEVQVPSTPPGGFYHSEGKAEIIWEPGTPTVSFGDAIFIRQCPHCARFVKPDESMRTNWLFETPENAANATCKVHGRVKMPLAGYAE